MGSFREVLTFQLGNYSNYIGAHWWNIQESYFSYDEKNPSEINHDVLFREGKTFKGVPTFTPRTIVIDKKENSSHIPILDDNQGTSRKNSTVVWDPDRVSTEVIKTIDKHEYIQDLEKMDRGRRVSKKDYNFEETVRSWCDFMRSRYHPKSLCLVNNDFEIDIFSSGSEMFKSVEDDLTEKIRSYMEECNHLQGYQLLVDSVDGFGGLAHDIVMHLRDEYPSKNIFIVPTVPSYYSSFSLREEVYKMINILLSYQKFSEYCDLVIPISTNRNAWRTIGPPIDFPHLIYDPRILYQTSAILAAYMDGFTLKFRLREGAGTLNDIATGLNFWKRNICAASMSLPFPMSEDAYLIETLENHNETQPLWTCLTPNCTIGDERIFYQRITIRGVSGTRLRDPSSRRTSQADTCTSIAELLHLYLSFYVNTISDVTYAKTPLKTEIPFPKIFNTFVTRHGSVEGESVRKENTEVLSCPVLTGLHSCKGIGRMLESLHTNVKGINIKRFHHYIDVGMDLDEYRECLEKVHLLGNEYVNELEL